MTVHRVTLGLGEVPPQIQLAICPKSALHHLPSQIPVPVDHALYFLNVTLVQRAEIRDR